MRSKLIRTIENALKKYTSKPIRIVDLQQEYDLAIFYEEEDMNYTEGFLFAVVQKKSEFTYFKSAYKPAVSSYRPRLSLILYQDQLLLKDNDRDVYLIRTVEKINQVFLRKIKKVLLAPSKETFQKLFDRIEIIEEFYILYKKARIYLLVNIEGIREEKKRREFVDNFMMQLLILWYLQERKFFNEDTNYFITKFHELKQQKLTEKNRLQSFYAFLIFLFKKISCGGSNLYYEDDVIGKVVILGSTAFLNMDWDSKTTNIPNECFYKEGLTERLINSPPERIGNEIPLLNLFESLDWIEDNIDGFVIGTIYEKFIGTFERKKSGAYYTPEEITRYICKFMIEPYLVSKINDKLKFSFQSLDHFFLDCDKEKLNCLFDELKTLTILDPAVGSAHFLESTINILLNIYERIFEKGKELGVKKGFEFFASDEQGNIILINPLELSTKELIRLYLKLYIILPRNIYGVDINPSALKVAKARLFLTLAKHFHINSGCFIRFPNVHFNLRPGNSLIGYVSLKEKQYERPIPPDFSLEEQKIQYTGEPVNIMSELSQYLKESTHFLNIPGDIVREIKVLNKILIKKPLTWNDFRKVLRTKEKLITILIATLNSQYAHLLNALLIQITDLFNDKLNEIFSKEHEIKLEDLKRIQSFHWLCEFPRVFMERGHFDLILGNPPYASKLNPIEISLLREKFPIIKGNNNSAMFFLFRAKELSTHGYIGMIIPKSFAYASNWIETRKYFINHLYLAIDTKEAFQGVKLEQIIVLFSHQDIPFYDTFSIDDPSSRIRIEKSYLNYPSENLGSLILITNQDALNLMLKIRQTSSINLGDVTETRMGVNLQKLQISRRTKYPTLSGKHIGRFFIKNIEHHLPSQLIDANKEKYVWFLSKKIVAQKIIAHVTKPRPHIIIMAALDKLGLITQNTVENTKIIDDRLSYDFIICLLNSRLMNWYGYHFIFSDAIRSMAYTQNSLSFMPMPDSKTWKQLNKRLEGFSSKIERLISAGHKEELLKIEKTTNDIIYEAYGLTPKEKDLVNSEFED